MDRKGLLQQQQFMNSILSPPNATVTSSILKKEHGLPQVKIIIILTHNSHKQFRH